MMEMMHLTPFILLDWIITLWQAVSGNERLAEGEQYDEYIRVMQINMALISHRG